MPAHTAPLGVTFYNRAEACDTVAGSFPCAMIGDLFIPFHASEWLMNASFYGNRVSWLPINSTTGLPTGIYNTIIYEENVAAGNCGNGCFRPVNAVFGKDGHMFVSSDWAAEVYRVTYGTPPPTISKYIVNF
jgi:glucose/arabinose dehydrogenase